MYGRRYAGERPYAETDPSGRYGRFEETLGKGSMKTVYRAFDELQGMEVAWNQAKIFDVLRSPEALERLYSEVHILSTINHESVIRFYSSWVDTKKRTFNFITEMFTSGTLREYRQRYRHVDICAVKNWARQILRGLVYLHNHDPPVIHRDLKCDNIFINGHLGQVKIGDLGLAAVLRGSHHAHTVIGTPEFMAPELYDEEYNELVDVYSFGMCVLEMLTAEYPYSECFSPAQIYKKVTSGKLPGALVRVDDQEARRFIRRCLEGASRRSSAADLLLDPFLQPNPHQISSKDGFHSSTSTVPMAISSHPVVHQGMLASIDMKVTGKKNPDDDSTIFLTVQMTDKDGHDRNIYFPFDTLNDTPTDVAEEMVKELDITDHDSSQIARMIDQEVSTLVPHWRGDWPINNLHHTSSYIDDDHYLSSPTSSQASSSSLVPSKSHGGLCKAEIYSDGDDSDTASQISTYSGKYAYVNYNSGGEQGAESLSSPQSQQPSRLCPEEITKPEPLVTDKLQKRRYLLAERPQNSIPSISGKGSSKNSQLTRNRSLVDMRSQLLHRSLMDQLKKRLSKTVGSVESIGYQNPCEGSSKDKKSFAASKKWGLTWGRG